MQTCALEIEQKLEQIEIFLNVQVSNMQLKKIVILDRYSVPVTKGKKYIGVFHRGAAHFEGGYTVDMSIGSADFITATANSITGRGHGDDVNYGSWTIELYEIL